MFGTQPSASHGKKRGPGHIVRNAEVSWGFGAETPEERDGHCGMFYARLGRNPCRFARKEDQICSPHLSSSHIERTDRKRVQQVGAAGT